MELESSRESIAIETTRPDISNAHSVAGETNANTTAAIAGIVVAIIAELMITFNIYPYESFNDKVDIDHTLWTWTGHMGFGYVFVLPSMALLCFLCQCPIVFEEDMHSKPVIKSVRISGRALATLIMILCLLYYVLWMIDHEAYSKTNLGITANLMQCCNRAR